jgi:hypothetical protein
MRYGFVPESQMEEQSLEGHHTIQPLFDPLLPVLQARAIMTAVRLRIFEALADGMRTEADVAAELSLDVDALRLLFRVLINAGYLSCDGSRYGVTDVVRATLLPVSPTPLSAWVEYNHAHWNVISKLEEVVRTGKGVDLEQNMGTEVTWSVHQRAMLETARPAAPWVAAQVPVRDGARRMLDLGGSHGLYGALICREHPPMKSEVLELPQTAEHARVLAREEGIDDVVGHRVGDVLTADMGAAEVDAVFLGNLVHHFTADQNQNLLGRVETALVTGGTVIIWDFKAPDVGERPDLVGDGLALLFRMTSEARCYTTDEIVGWLRSARFQDITRHSTPLPSQMLVTGRAAR